jgi:RHS repeat-associated protein
VKSYVYLGARLLATIAPNGASERVEYHHPDRLGTRVVTNNQDTTSFEQVSLPFGTALDAESSGSTKRRFTSYDRSTVTGLDYAVNRHYDPLQGRFTQVDPIGMRSTSLANPQTLNLYAYSANDPINHSDPSGLGFFSWLKSVFKKVVAAFVAAVVAVVVVLITGGNFRAALKAGREAFHGAFQVNSGYQPSGGWGRTPPTFGSGPTLRQILGQTSLGRRLTSDNRWFLTPGTAGNGFVAAARQIFDAGETMAKIAEQPAKDAIRKVGAANWDALGEFDRSLSQRYLGNDGMGSTPWSAMRFFRAPLHPNSLWGDGGFKARYQDHEGDQTHHFVAFLSAGINSQADSALLHRYLTDYNNKADRDLGATAYTIGDYMARDPMKLWLVGDRIRDWICDSK